MKIGPVVHVSESSRYASTDESTVARACKATTPKSVGTSQLRRAEETKAPKDPPLGFEASTTLSVFAKHQPQNVGCPGLAIEASNTIIPDPATCETSPRARKVGPTTL